MKLRCCFFEFKMPPARAPCKDYVVRARRDSLWPQAKLSHGPGAECASWLQLVPSSEHRKFFGISALVWNEFLKSLAASRDSLHAAPPSRQLLPSHRIILGRDAEG